MGKLKGRYTKKNIVKVLGDNNREIINNIVSDIVKNSYQKNAIL